MLIKRIFDLLVSLLGIIVLTPLFIVVAIAIKFDSVGPVFFRQDRVGQYGHLFRIFKFRTMNISSDYHGSQITVGDDPRITVIGYLLRKYKIDELPQLIDVFLGRMSLVGPRPEVPMYVDLYPQDIKKIVLSLKPGVTDLASIEFKTESLILAQSIDPQREYVEKIMPIKLKHYVEYAKNRTFLGDILIILRTIKAVIS